MGIYWCAMDHNVKQKFRPPGKFANKSLGIFFPTSPFPGMFVMMNSLGYNFQLINDMYDDIVLYQDDYKDVTEEVYNKYLEYFPWAKDEIYESNNKEEE